MSDWTLSKNKPKQSQSFGGVYPECSRTGSGHVFHKLRDANNEIEFLIAR